MKRVFSVLSPRGQELPDRRNQAVARVSEADEKPSRDRSAEGFGSIWMVRGFLLLQIAMFLVLASIHFGLSIAGYRHHNAGTTEALITAILFAGLLLTWSPPPWNRWAATAAQSVGTLGILVGLTTIALGIGSQTVLDLTLNAALLLTLISGLSTTTRGARHVQSVRMGS